MVLGARLPYLSCLQRLVLHRINQTPFSNPKSLSSSKTKHSHSLDGDCDDFLPWLEQKAKTEISSVLSIGKSALGRALFASKFIRTGDCILKVPYTVQLAPDNLVPEIKSLLSNKVSKVAIVAIVILVERRMGKNSEWAPYITRLPHSNEMHNPIFWSELELEMIHQSSLYQETINHKCLIEEEFLAVRPVFERFPEIFERITCEDFMHVHALVTSRAWGSAKGASLIPFADFLNHDETSKAFVLNDDENQFSEVVADRDYDPGEQVLIRYGKFSNATLMLDFGFTLSDNIYDQVHIQVKIPQHDPLCQMKLELLQRHHKPVIKDAHAFHSSIHSFTIKEVRPGSTKGKGIPQSLRAFVRVLGCNSPQELSDLAMDAEQSDGRLARRPLSNRSREIKAHQILISLTTRLIKDYDASVKSLATSTSPCVCQRLARRRKMSLDLLSGELRLLKSASAWLKNYCASLTSADYHLL